MTEYEFRGKQLDNGEWVYGYYVKGATRHCIVQSLAVFPRYDVDPETVGQFTGLHDDSEQQEKLFDGDIAELEYQGHKHICKIQFCAGGYMFVADSFPDGFLFLSELAEYDRNYGWVEGAIKIGTIHDNPELLER